MGAWKILFEKMTLITALVTGFSVAIQISGEWINITQNKDIVRTFETVTAWVSLIGGGISFVLLVSSAILKCIEMIGIVEIFNNYYGGNSRHTITQKKEFWENSELTWNMMSCGQTWSFFYHSCCNNGARHYLDRIFARRLDKSSRKKSSKMKHPYRSVD